jgi:hypothetical protein
LSDFKNSLSFLDYIYAIGGKSETGCLSSVERYGLEEEEWVYIEDLPLATYDHASCVHDDLVGSFPLIQSKDYFCIFS